ncbi:MAG: glycosyltransferase, partial [Ignavibacteriaceae bacterium]
MKVVHLCTQDFGGAGNAAYRLHKGLQAIGVESTFIVLDKKSKDPSVKVIPDNQPKESSYCNSPDSYSSSRMKLMWKYWADMLKEYPGRVKGLEIFTDNSCTVRLDLVKEIAEADIINLHWVAGMINFKELPLSLKGKNILWTLHDMNPFTGGCHYTGKCNKFLNGCNACPQLGSISQKDKSYYSFGEKGEAYKELQINVVTPSKWLGDEAKRSSLFSKFQVDVIPYGLPLDVFKVYEKDELRQKLNIPLSKKIILFGANDVMNHRKGFSLLLDTLEQLADHNEGDVALGIFGDLPPGTPIQSKYQILNFGTINSENTLALVYSLADVFVLPSLEDNLPNTVLESLACGTPVVAFNIGGMPDMISHKKTGYLADEGDIKDLGEGISWTLRNNSNDFLRNACREFAVKHYDLQIQANAYLKKYNEILSRKYAEQSGGKTMINLKTDKWNAYTFSKKNHFNVFEKLPGFNTIDPDKCDLKVYQDLLAFNFIKNNVPVGSKILEIGGGNSRVIESLKNDYECWNIDKFEGNGNGPTAINDKKGFQLVLDYIGNFNPDLPENYFDCVFSISALEHVPENEETYKNILQDIDRVLKPGGYSFHCFDVVLQKETTWTNGLLPYLFNKTKTLNEFIPFEDISKDDDLYVMSKDSYEYYWHKYTDKSYEEFGRPLSYNIFWQKTATPKVESPFVPIIKDKNKFPKISIVTPSFNQGEYLEECIDSILSQNYPNLEYVVMDGGSSDNSVEIIKKYEKFLSYWQSKPDGGQYKAIQTGFEKTTGSIMSWLNSDDKLHPNALYKIAYLFTFFPTVEWVTGRPSFWNKEGELTGIHEIMPRWTRERLLAKKYNDPFIQQESTFWKRSLWEKAGGHLDTNLDLAGDLELWMRFFRHTDLYSFNALIAGWRNHGDQKALMFMDKYNQEAAAAIEKEIIHWNEAPQILPCDGDTIINFESRMIENNEGLNLSSIRNEYAWKSYNKDVSSIKDYADQKKKTEILSLLEAEFNLHDVQNQQSFKTSGKSARTIPTIGDTHNEKLPRISIITPSYNQGEFLEDTIKSVLDQNYPNLEYIIIDGGSSDNSVEIIKKYEKYLTYWVSEKDNGQTDAINKGFKKATGEIVAWINSDDYYFPGALNLIAEMYLSDPDAGLYIGNGAVADRSGKKIRRYSHDIIFDYQTLLRGSNYILQPSTFVNAKAIKEVGYLDVSLFYAMDLEYWLRIASKFSVTTINEELSAYRWYDDIKTKTGGLKRWVEQWGIIHQHSKLQMTPGLLVEFFNVLQEKEVNDHLGINVTEFSQKIRMQFYQVMQQLLNTNECIPKQGNGKIFLPTVKSKSVESSNEKKTLNIVRSLGSKPKIDIVMPEGHSWFVREGYAEALKHYGVFNKSFYVNQNDSNREIFEYLKNPTSDFILLMNTDWHAQYLHNNVDWQKRWEANNSTKILFSFECMNNPTIKKDARWWNDNITAVDNALKSADAVVFAHEIDEELFSKYGKPILWQPFAIDEQLFPQPKKYAERISKSFFKGKTTPFYYEGTYSQRRKLIDTLKNFNKTEIFDSYEEEIGTTKERALNFISTMNNYQIVLGLPSLSPTMVVRPFEAMASGAVFFQNKILGEKSNKLFTDGVDIINYDADKPEELLSSIETILNDPESSEQIAEAGYQKVLNNHTIKHRMNEMLGWIENNFAEAQIAGELKGATRLASKTSKIVVDGIIFQLQKNQPLGISRVWTSLLTELGKKENNILLLDRGNTAPDIPGIEKISIPLFYDYEVMTSEVCYLDEICFENNAALFISTYYTYTEHTPSLLMLHDFIPELFKWEGSEWSAKEEAIQKAFAYLSVSESTARDLKKFYPENKNKDVSIIYNAVSDEFSHKSEEEVAAFKKKYKIEKPYFIISGNRNLYKNVIQFAAAFSKLKNKNDFEILFTGGSPELELDIKKLLGKAKYQIVYLTVDELSTAYSGAVALVYPSKYEGFGLPIIEAMKSGCPVITCKNSSLKEVAGEAAIFVKEDDVEGLKNALVKVEKPEVREKYIKTGLENAKKFSWTLSGELLAKRISSYLETYNPIPQKPQPNLGSVDNLFHKIKTDKLFSKAYDELFSQLKMGFEANEELIKQTEKIVGSIDAQKYLLPKTVDQHNERVYPYYYYVLALSYLNRNDYHKSLEAFSLALSHGMNHWIIGSHLADLLIHFNKLDDALVMLEKIRSIYPQHENTLMRISEIKKGETKKLKEFKVSAIVSTYNSEKFLRGCLDDLINQTLYKKGELEIVIVNSGSTQNEEQIVKEYQSQFANIKYTKTERETVYQAWNRGIKIAAGKYVTNANTDDRHRKDALEIFAHELDANEKIGLVYADQFVTKKENQTFDDHDAAGYFEWLEFDRLQLIHCACVGPQPMWRKSLHEKFGFFDESLKVAGDYDWWLRISEKVQFKHIPERLGLYLLSDNSVEHRHTDEMRNETVKVRLHYGKKAQLQKLDYTKYKSTFLVFTSKEQPLISVIIPTFNRLDKLKKAISSVLEQSYKNIEVLVVNDAGENVTDIIEQFSDRRIKLINHPTNKGLAASRNTGIKAANGEYIALLDDDDLFYSNHLQIALNNLSDEHRVIYSDAVRNSYIKVGEVFTLQAQSIPYSIDYNRNKLLVGNIAPVNCFVFQKSLVTKVGLFDESLPVLEDWDFWLRLSSVTEFKHVKENTVQVNWYNDGSTMTSSKGKEFEVTRKLINQKYESEINSIPNSKEIIA